MHPDEIEESGMRCEQQNCLAEAQMAMNEHSYKQQLLVDETLKKGLFAVVVSFPWFCKSTDAFAGVAIGFSGAYPTREAANEMANKLRQETDEETYAVHGPDDEAIAEANRERELLAAQERALSNQMGDEVPF